MKNFKISFIALFLSGAAFGQQDIQFSQTLSNPYLFNPAAGGMSNVTELNLGFRSQWLNVEGKPVTYYASGQSQIRFGKSGASVLDEFNTEKKSMYATPQRTIGRKHILGGKVVSDLIGPFNKTSVMGSYAIHLPLTQKVNMGLGIGLGWSSFSINESKVSLIKQADQAYLSYLGQSNRQNFVDVNTGIVFYNDHFFLGLSGSQFLKNKARFQDSETHSSFERHYYVVGSYRFDLMTKYAIEPVVILKSTTSSPMSYDAGVRFHYQRMGWLSLSYRNNSAICAGFGVNLLKQFRVAYAFEFGLAGQRAFGAGAHEIQLGFLIGRNKNRKEPVVVPVKNAEEQQQLDDELTPGTE